MPKKKGKKGKKATKSKKRSSSRSKQLKLSPEEAIKAYISGYIDSYVNSIEDLNLNEADFPLFYTCYPFDAIGYILPDNSTCILFRGLADAVTIEVKKADFEPVDREIVDGKYDHICCYPPSHSYTQKEAAKQARKDVEQDVENTRHLKPKDAKMAERDDTLRTIRLLRVAIPWLSARKTAQVGSQAMQQTEAMELSPEDLRMKEDEDFSSYSERLKNLETSLLQGSKEGLTPDEQEMKVEPALEPVDITQSQTPATKDVPSPAKISIPPTGTPGANISIEIKQPEAVGREAYEDKRDIEILRLKRTLYDQTRAIEDLERDVGEIGNKLGNVEQMRQTVFRINRKVYDADAKMVSLEKSNRELIRRVEDMLTGQIEENKRMRRFITEKAKKARNQAMIVAIILSLASLPFLIMLLITFWGEIKTMLGF